MVSAAVYKAIRNVIRCIDLEFNHTKITDAGLFHLRGERVNGVQKINLRWCRQITDTRLTHLLCIQKNHLNGCTKITDAGLVL